MNFYDQMRAYLAKNPEATRESAWVDGYFQCLTNMCNAERFSDDERKNLKKKII